ncbi:Maintenance of ploidy protein mob2 [Fulvia fulva]|uniref:Maintenance of ploidy protein mob2 n=1 Tax=Passalora fulva TaxID=5499 RepID=A0A9Q8L6R9_PASFU|nr:Maintenance of ploidy protein mob2 [Fulvia fulva]KAK4634989.1 Maintenance of ploidy protein mob2 [Fulvia fulva]KAK4637793.1 Maintenance of ploidy protein mob2 [Fulvia fulva]UJO11868.1 Maintenance of ploidy protein mob2 [Fulvia fulva]WPV10001.1 Maintenance of ploidy protein mob2 [Fulvia fulva]WPV23785.1 Maintenance of ploidy protein mob2 [Fulvia fulva]
MSSWMNNLRNLGRGPSQQRSTPNQQPSGQPPSRGGNSSPSANSPSSLAPPTIPATPASPSLTVPMQNNEQAHQANQGHQGPKKNPPFFFREKLCGFIVKGNFMTLGAKPHMLEEGEWIAHQVVEQNRLLGGMVKMTQTEDRSTGVPVCNVKDCPTMSAGPVTWTWIDTRSQPINLPAPTYIKHIQTWVAGKIQDESLLPTNNFQTAPPLPDPQQVANDPNHWLGKSSGFPQRFETEVKMMYKQMFRIYAHLYWQHWLQFWDLSSHTHLNTCFIHFINVGRIFGLLTEKDTEAMQPLIDLWIARGDIPQVSVNGNVATPPTAASTTTTAAPPSASAANTQPPGAAPGSVS